MRKNEHALAAFFLAGLCFFLALGSLRAQSGDAPAATAWTDTDSRLANHYLKLLQGNPEYGNILDLLWDLYAKKNQTPLLLDYIGKAAKVEKGYIPKLIFAHLLRKAEKIDEARAFYDEVAAGLPENIPALRALAEISEQQKRDSKAMSYYTRLLKLIPATEDDGVAIRFRVAAMHQSRGQVKAAIPIWNEILQLRAHDPKIRSEVIALLLEVGETTAAITELHPLNPGRTDGSNKRACKSNFLSLKSFQKAIQAWADGNLSDAQALLLDEGLRQGCTPSIPAGPTAQTKGLAKAISYH